jgi:hypothetical protein
MPLSNGQIPVLANVPNSGVGLLSGTTIGTMGSNTNGVTIYTAGSLGGRVYSLIANSTDTAISNVYIYILRGSTVVPIGLVPVAINSGNITGTRNNDMLDGINIVGMPLDTTGKRYIPLQGSDILRCSTLVSVTSTKAVWVTAFGADYQA